MGAGRNVPAIEMSPDEDDFFGMGMPREFADDVVGRRGFKPSGVDDQFSGQGWIII